MKDYIKELILKFKEWWSNLAVREQQAVSAGSIVVVAFIIYQFIWSPLSNHVTVMRKQIDTQSKLLAWMQSADKEIQQLQSQGKEKTQALSPVALLAFLQKKVNQAGLASQMTQLKQSSNDSVTLQFKKVDFDKLIKLLTAITSEQRIIIAQMSAIAEGAPGIVNADVTLKLG